MMNRLLNIGERYDDFVITFGRLRVNILWSSIFGHWLWDVEAWTSPTDAETKTLMLAITMLNKAEQSGAYDGISPRDFLSKLLSS